MVAYDPVALENLGKEFPEVERAKDMYHALEGADALVIATGIIGAVMVTPLMNALGIRDYAARGFAVGLASHGIGTARAFTVDPVAGTASKPATGFQMPEGRSVDSCTV